MYIDSNKFKKMTIPGIVVQDLIDLAPHLHLMGGHFNLLLRYFEAQKGKHIRFEDFIEQLVLGINSIDNKHARYFASKLILLYIRDEARKFGYGPEEITKVEGTELNKAKLDDIIDKLYYYREDDYVTTYYASFFTKYKEIKEKEIKVLMLKELYEIYRFYHINPNNFVVFVQPELRKLKELGIKR